MDALYLEQCELWRKLEAFFTTLSSRSKAEQTRGLAESQQSRMEHYLGMIEENHERARKSQSKNKSHKCFTENLMDSIEDSYSLAKGVFNDFFHELNVEKQLASPSQVLNQTIQAETQSTVSYHNLPKINLPTFSGKH